MRRKGARTGGVALVVLLALLALASVAQAAEYGRCVSVEKGEYADAGCINQTPLPHTGGFEWEAPPKTFTGEFGVTEGETEKYGTLVCASATFEGAFTGPKTSTVVDVYSGCEAGGKKCHSLNTAVPGRIITFQLESTLIDHGEKG